MEHYLKYQNLIRKKAYERIASNPSLDFDELIALGNLSYCEALRTWDEKKGAFSTHLTYRLKHEMGKHLQKQYKYHNNTITENPLDDYHPHPVDPFRKYLFCSALKDLSSEATEVVNLIFGSAGELCDFTLKQVMVSLKGIRRYLRSLRWDRMEINKAINEIKTMLDELEKGGK